MMTRVRALGIGRIFALGMVLMGCGSISSGISHVPMRVRNAVDRGPMVSAEPIEVVVGLRCPLSPEDYRDLTSRLDAQGLTVSRASVTRDFLTLQGAVSSFERS